MEALNMIPETCIYDSSELWFSVWCWNLGLTKGNYTRLQEPATGLFQLYQKQSIFSQHPISGKQQRAAAVSL